MFGCNCQSHSLRPLFLTTKKVNNDHPFVIIIPYVYVDANFEEDEDNDENGNKVYPAKRHSPKKTKNEKSSPTSGKKLTALRKYVSN